LSLLKKLKKISRGKTEIVRETVKDPNEVQAQQQNAAFRMLTGTYVLLQRILRARDIIFIERRNPFTKKIERVHEGEMDALVAGLVTAVEKTDDFFRNNFLVNKGNDVTDIDVIAQYFYEVIDGMERMSLRDIEILVKVVKTILTAGRYMHIDSEEAYLQTLLTAAQNGMDLAKKGRKRVTMNDIKAFVKPKEK
jgi:hypothetical protein